jgi:hypothetical protein
VRKILIYFPFLPFLLAVIGFILMSVIEPLGIGLLGAGFGLVLIGAPVAVINVTTSLLELAKSKKFDWDLVVALLAVSLYLICGYFLFHIAIPSSM